MVALDSIAITYEEALCFNGISDSDPAMHKPYAHCVQSLKTEKLAFASQPMHVLLPNKKLSNSIKGASCHVHEKPLPGGSFVRINNDSMICSPELCFLQMASRIPFYALVKLGIELCGLYTAQPDGSIRYDRTIPLATPKAITDYLDGFGKHRGLAAARKALPYLVAASGSPMETALVIMFCIPPRHGGYGLPLPHMNYRVDARHEGRSYGGKHYYLCDLCWPDKGVSVEYDSDQEHTGSERIAQDAQRRNDLLDLGIATITATHKQVMDAEQFDRLVHQLARMLGFRIRDERGWGLPARGRLFRKIGSVPKVGARTHFWKAGEASPRKGAMRDRPLRICGASARFRQRLMGMAERFSFEIS